MARFLGCVMLGAVLAVGTGCEGEEQPPSTVPESPIDRVAYGPPRLDGPTVLVAGHPYFASILQVETTHTPTPSELGLIEAKAGGTTCGASAFSDVYFVCLSTPATDSNALRAAVVRTAEPTLVTGVGPVDAAPAAMNGPGDLSYSCDPIERKHLNRTGATAAVSLLSQAGVASSELPPVAILDMGFFQNHEALAAGWSGQALDFAEGPGAPVGSATLCPPELDPKSRGAFDCDVYYHDPEDILKIDHGTTVASAASGVLTGPFGTIPFTAYKTASDYHPPPDRSGGPLYISICLASESAIANGATVINLSATVIADPISDAALKEWLPEKPSGYCRPAWWDAQLTALDKRNGVFVTTAGNMSNDIDVDSSNQVLLDKPGTITVGATWRDAPDRWEGLACDHNNCGSNYRSQHPMVYAPGGDICLAEHDAVAVIPDPLDPAPNDAPGRTYGAVYGYGLGTSFAAPQVAALVAAMKAVNPSLSAAQMQQILLNTGVPVKDGKNAGSREIRYDRAIAEALGMCAGQCPAAGATQCDADSLQTCQANAADCRYWQEQQDCAASGEVCTMSGPDAACMSGSAGAGGSGGGSGGFGGAGGAGGEGGSGGGGTCNDSMMNGAETDVDCGGADCGACAEGRMCGMNVDCTSQSCVAGVCAAGGGIADLALGSAHTCSRNADGTVLCWGLNASGQLGHGTGVNTSSPTLVPGLTGVAEIAAGNANTCARKTDGTILCWGNNLYGQLGGSPSSNEASPWAVPGLTDVAGIALGGGHTCARKTDGTVLCWGLNIHGQLGDGTMENKSSPTLVPGLTGVAEIVLGFHHSCARKLDASVLCWGANSFGELGDGTTVDKPSPTTVLGLNGVAELALGAGFTCARKTDGTVLCWGSNNSGQLGDGTTVDKPSPTTVPGLSSVAEIGVSGVNEHSCARKTNGTVLCWGLNNSGQLGDGTTVSRASPTSIFALTGVADLALGSEHTCARKTDGQLLCWGWNGFGQLGDGTTVNEPSPTLVVFP